MAGSAVGDNTSGLLGAFHDKRILEVLENNVAYYQLADKRPLAVKNGNTITFHTVSELERGKSLTEGVQPAAQFMSAGTKTATIRQIGDVVAVADVMAKSAIADMINLAVERLGEAAARTIDEYVQDRLFSEMTESYSGTEASHGGPLACSQYNSKLSCFYNGVLGGLSAFALSGNNKLVSVANVTALSAAAGTYRAEVVAGVGKMTLKMIRKHVVTLKEANVRPYAGGKYAIVCRPIVVASIHDDPEFVEWNRYQNAEKMFNYEVGNVEGCRIIESTNQLSFNHGLNVNITAYNSTILGAQAFAITEFSGDTGVQVYTVPFDNKDSGNVLQQNAYVGYKWTGVCKVLDSTQGKGIITFNG